MDAKPLKTHIRSFRTFRIAGTILTLFGGTMMAIILHSLGVILILGYGFPSFYAGNAAFLSFWEYRVAYIVSSIIGAMLMMGVFAAGIVALAFSTRSKIKDANRGIDYQQL